MQKVINWLQGNLDKVCHFLACIVIAIVFSAIILHTTMGATLLVSATCGLIAAMMCGVFKEVFDFVRGGTIDGKDLLADLIGSIIGAALSMLILL